MEKFIVFANARSGTHFFESIINQHPEIQCFHEVFSKIETHHFFHFLNQKIKENEGNIIPSSWPSLFGSYLDEVYSHHSGFKAVGMDIKYYQIPWVPDLLGILKEKKIKVIHLIRKNILKHFIAWETHRMREQLGRKFHETKRVQPVKIQVPLNTINQELEKLRDTLNSYQNLLSNNFEYLEVAYEDCFDNPDLISQQIAPNVLDSVYDFLKIEDRTYDLKTDYVKSNPGLLSELTENYDELVEHLSGTEWAYLLNDTIGVNIMDAKTMCEQGEELVNNGKFQEAMELFLKAIKLEPNFAEGYNNIGVLLSESGNHSEALSFFKRAMELAPDNQLFSNNYQDLLQLIKNSGPLSA